MHLGDFIVHFESKVLSLTFYLSKFRTPVRYGGKGKGSVIVIGDQHAKYSKWSLLGQVIGILYGQKQQLLLIVQFPEKKD